MIDKLSSKGLFRDFLVLAHTEYPIGKQRLDITQGMHSSTKMLPMMDQGITGMPDV